MSFLLDVNRYSDVIWTMTFGILQTWLSPGKRVVTFDPYILSSCADFGQCPFPVSSCECAELGILTVQDWELETGNV